MFAAAVKKGIDALRGIVAVSTDEDILIDTLLHFNFDTDKSANWLIDHPGALRSCFDLA